MSEGPGPLTKRSSSRGDARKQSGIPYRRGSSRGSASTGLTKYLGDTSLDFNPDKGGAEEEGAGGQARSSKFGKPKFGFGKSRSTASAMPEPMEVELVKSNAREMLGITFEVPEDESLKGVVVAEIHEGGLVAGSNTLRVGDVVHAVNGRPVATPQEGAAHLSGAVGSIKLLVTRANARPASHAVAPGAAGAPSAAAGKQKEEEKDANTTVVVSCSQLIVESKRIVGTAAGLDAELDSLYTRLKAKDVSSQAALARLLEMVGQTTVEQAGLVIANAQQGTLPTGWVEYYDKGSSRYYYYNVHTKATTWVKPRKDKPPPPPRQSKPPPPPRPSAAAGAASAAAISGARPTGDSDDSDDDDDDIDAMDSGDGEDGDFGNFPTAVPRMPRSASKYGKDVTHALDISG